MARRFAGKRHANGAGGVRSSDTRSANLRFVGERHVSCSSAVRMALAAPADAEHNNPVVALTDAAGASARQALERRR